MSGVGTSRGQATILEAKISGRNWEHEEPPYERWAIGVAKDDRWKDSSDVTNIGGDKALIWGFEGNWKFPL